MKKKPIININIKIDITDDVFAKKCAATLLTQKYTIGNTILNILDSCFENAFKMIIEFNSISFIDHIESGVYKDVSIYLDDYIFKGYYSVSCYKIDVEFIDKIIIQDINIELPFFIIPEISNPEIIKKYKTIGNGNFSHEDT